MTAGLVLAAGRGERFGTTKQLAEVDGRPLVRIVVDTAVTAGLTPVAVVVGHDAGAVTAALPPDVVVVVNPDHADGQATSLRAGLAALAATAAPATVVLLADEPTVDATVVARVAAALDDGATLVRCRYEDRPGHPVGLARSRWTDAAAAPGRDAGARALLGGDDTVVVEVAGPAPVDVDHTDDLAAVRVATGSRGRHRSVTGPSPAASPDAPSVAGRPPPEEPP